MKLRIKYMVLLLALVFGMAACKSRATPEPKWQGSVLRMQKEDVSGWTGYYSRIGTTRDNGSLDMDFLVYEESGQLYGYLAVNGYERTESGSIHPQRRILTTVSIHGEEMFVYFYEDILDFGEEDVIEAYFGSYRRGDLLFSMKMEGEGILTTWEKPFAAETEESLTERKFYNWAPQHITCDLLGEADRAAFLAARGVKEEEAPFFVYYNAEGILEFTIWVDEAEKGGTGIYYFYDTSGKVFTQGFGIPACEKEMWADSRFDVTKYGDTGEWGVDDYTESYEYNEQGQIIRFVSEGLITDYGTDGADPFRDRVIEITYSYRKDGSLERKEGFYNAIVFDSSDCSMTSDYDTEGRLIHTSGYITHGSMERYYIYSEGNPCPDYGLMLDYDYAGGISAYAFIRYTY